MLSDFFSRIYQGATHAVGKIKQFGSAVGKHIKTFAQRLTPEASGNARFSGFSATLLKITRESYEEKRQKNIDGYELDEDLSNSNTVVYHNSNNVIIGFRGTANIDDLITDIQVVKGTSDNIRFKQAVEIYNKVKNKYPDLKIYATGHSLGGSLALYLNSLYGIPVETFNPGMGLGFLKKNPHANNATLNIIKGDILSSLSGLSSLGKINVYNPINPEGSARDAHSIRNFI
jgi:hypothetical protein